tara:strand:- start:386 stop:724 length:339 start_codon:yes stop_codon:yes gene_type:complete
MTQEALLKALPKYHKHPVKPLDTAGKLPYNIKVIKGKEKSKLTDCDKRYLLIIMKIEQKLLTLKQVIEIVSLSKSTIYRWIESGRFPKPLNIGGNSVRWKTSDVHDWIEGLV